MGRGEGERAGGALSESARKLRAARLPQGPSTAVAWSEARRSGAQMRQRDRCLRPRLSPGRSSAPSATVAIVITATVLTDLANASRSVEGEHQRVHAAALQGATPSGALMLDPTTHVADEAQALLTGVPLAVAAPHTNGAMAGPTIGRVPLPVGEAPAPGRCTAPATAPREGETQVRDDPSARPSCDEARVRAYEAFGTPSKSDERASWHRLLGTTRFLCSVDRLLVFHVMAWKRPSQHSNLGAQSTPRSFSGECVLCASFFAQLWMAAHSPRHIQRQTGIDRGRSGWAISEAPSGKCLQDMVSRHIDSPS